uniref:Uncharacterized protein n=1 Tax=Xenopus tropicalis TaxID=8364 RepID=A0A6I8QMX0_XENTR
LLLARFKEENCNLAQIKVDEVLCFMCYIAAKVSANDAVPIYLLDIGSNVFLNIILLHCLCGTVNSILLHVFRHVSILDNSLSVRHGAPVTRQNILGWVRVSVFTTQTSLFCE